MESTSLLVSDVDGTLLGDDVGLVEFADWFAGVRHRFRLVYNSGRFLDSVVESIENSWLPTPDAIIGGVGTEVGCYPTIQRMSEWPKLNGNWDAARVRNVLAVFRQLQPQPERFQSQFKISFFGNSLSTEFLNELQARLASNDLEADVVYSSQRDLDILPAGINKGSAAAWLASQWGIAKRDVIVCGDSGNDLSMFQRGFQGVVVANAQSELLAIRDRVYHSNQPYAAGVLEGLRFWMGSKPTTDS